MSQIINQNIQKRNLDALIQVGALKITDKFFIYTSGKIGNYFINSEKISKDAKLKVQASDDMATIIKANNLIKDESNTIISGGESRDWVFSFSIQESLQRRYGINLGATMLYKDGSFKIFSKDEIQNKRFIHIADLNNQGSSHERYWTPMIRNANAIIEDAVFYVDRKEPEGIKTLEELGLNSYSVVSLDKNAWQYLIENNSITKNAYDSLNERFENKEEWEKKTLFSQISYLKDQLITDNEKTRLKALGVINNGYPNLKEDLVDRLKYIGYKGPFE